MAWLAENTSQAGYLVTSITIRIGLSANRYGGPLPCCRPAETGAHESPMPLMKYGPLVTPAHRGPHRIAGPHSSATRDAPQESIAIS